MALPSCRLFFCSLTIGALSIMFFPFGVVSSAVKTESGGTNSIMCVCVCYTSFIAGQFIVNGSSCDECEFPAKRQQTSTKQMLIKLNDLQGDRTEKHLRDRIYIYNTKWHRDRSFNFTEQFFFLPSSGKNCE